MIDHIYQKKWVVSRHKEAPLLEERERFLEHCQQQGTSHKVATQERQAAGASQRDWEWRRQWICAVKCPNLPIGKGCALVDSTYYPVRLAELGSGWAYTRVLRRVTMNGASQEDPCPAASMESFGLAKTH
jgi:hypothetical protein